MITRRGIFTVLTGIIAAPLVMKAEMLMPLRGVVLEPSGLIKILTMDQLNERIIKVATHILDMGYPMNDVLYAQLHGSGALR